MLARWSKKKKKGGVKAYDNRTIDHKQTPPSIAAVECDKLNMSAGGLKLGMSS
jgi:hypothetical protein